MARSLGPAERGSGATAGGTPVIGIVGAGTMGAGIAQVALEHGHRVLLNDVNDAAIERGVARIRRGLVRGAAKGDVSEEDAKVLIGAILDRLDDGATLEGIAGQADVVIEAALEDLDVKRRLFAELGAASRPDALLATNTSALSIAAIASAARHPERVVGLHFFNPAPVMALVEVVAAPSTDRRVAARAGELVTGWGKSPVFCADVPGFIVNRVNRPFTLEGLRILAEGQASIEEIDEAIRGDGFPMGPFQLMDLVGIDVNLAVARVLYEAFSHASRFQPSPIQEDLVAAGRLGRKTGEGFYRYDEAGRLLGPSEAFAAPSVGGGRLSDAEIVQRIVMGIVNEAYHAIDDEVADPDSIDLALRLGASHPIGPFERVEEMGGPAMALVAIEGLAYREGDRFRPARSLQIAAGG